MRDQLGAGEIRVTPPDARYATRLAKFIALGAPARVVRPDGSLDEEWLERHGWIERTLNGAATHTAIGFHRPWYYRVWGKIHFAYWRRRHHYRPDAPLGRQPKVGAQTNT